MPENAHRILVTRRGELVPRVPQDPLISSVRNRWTGVRLERHRLNGPANTTGVIEGFQICCNLTGPVPVEWLVDGRWQAAPLTSGDLCIATHGEFRSVAWRQPYDLLLLSLSPLLMAETSADAGKVQMIELEPRRAFRDRTIESICKLLLADTIAGTPAGPVFGEQLASSLAVYLASRFATSSVSLHSSRSCLPGPVLSRVCDLIEARLGTPIGLQDLAREARMSRFYFSRLFRNTTGESPYRYLLKRRVERAKDLLARGDSEADVASATGFSSSSHLASIFRRWTGVTPRQFRSLSKS